MSENDVALVYHKVAIASAQFPCMASTPHISPTRKPRSDSECFPSVFRWSFIRIINEPNLMKDCATYGMSKYRAVACQLERSSPWRTSNRSGTCIAHMRVQMRVAECKWHIMAISEATLNYILHVACVRCSGWL